MPKLIPTNLHDLPVPIIPWLMHDQYDYQPDALSATALIRPIRQSILAKRANEQDSVIRVPRDITEGVASKMGTAVHNDIENVFYSSEATGYLEQQGFDLQDHTISFEQRITRTMSSGVKVSGKYDCVCDGQLYDFKNTTTFTYTSDSNAEAYKLQGSIYRYLNPGLITEPTIGILFIFKDWKSSKAEADDKYPRAAVVLKHYPLLTVHETEKYIEDKVEEYKTAMDLPEAELPRCSDSDRWKRKDVFKYYKNPLSKRATKVFDQDLQAAQDRYRMDGMVGEVRRITGNAIKCNPKYCDGYDLCTQRLDQEES